MRKMKNSGIEWIGMIPEEWELYKVKHLFKIGRGRVISELELDDDGLYPVYSSQTKNNGCLGYINTYDFDVDQLTWTTDGVYAGTVFIRHGKHNCTNVCGTLQQLTDDNNLEYMKYALEFIATYHKRPDTNGAKIMNNEMAEIKITLPPLKEQQRIAGFLNKKCSKLENLYSDIEQQINVLKQYKKSVITEIITKGLNPDAKMKNSGVEWIGVIPEEWEVSKIKYSATKIGSGKTPKGGAKIYEDEGITFIRSQNVYDDGLHLDDVKYINQLIDSEMKNTRLQYGDVLLNITGASIGRCCIYNIKEKGNVNQHVCIIRTNEGMINDFLRYIMNSEIGTVQTIINQMGGNRESLTFEQIGSFVIPVPPFIEQQEIVDYLDKKCSEIDGIIKDKKEQLETLEQYKKSLIYEYVTGKKEVPNE